MNIFKIVIVLGLFNMVKPNCTKPNQTEINNMVWSWNIPYKPNEYDFIKTLGFGYGLVYNRLNRINRSKVETCKYVHIL